MFKLVLGIPARFALAVVATVALGGSALAQTVVAEAEDADVTTQALTSYTQRVRTLAPRTGVTIRYVSHHRPLATAPIKAAVVLLAGGNGVLNINAKGAIQALQKNFLIRTRELFLRRGVAMVAAVDAPSDSLPTGLDGNVRLAPNYATDIARVIRDIRAFTKFRVWVVGTSAGTIGAASVTTRLTALQSPDAPKGLVLTSSLVRIVPGQCGKTVFMANLPTVRVPTYIASHRDDACACTPASGAGQIYNALTGTTAKTRRIFIGGLTPVSDVCEALSYHGFYGIEPSVVGAITAFIDVHTP